VSLETAALRERGRANSPLRASAANQCAPGACLSGRAGAAPRRLGHRGPAHEYCCHERCCQRVPTNEPSCTRGRARCPSPAARWAAVARGPRLNWHWVGLQSVA